jgi:hypothetical protein
MFGPCPVVRVKHDNHEGFCEINESDFDPKKHELFDSDEGAKKATVAELREALTAKGIEIPEGAKKADLLALLDSAT